LDSTLKNHLVSIEAIKNAIEHKYDNYNTEQLNYKSSEDSWSLLQVLEHLVLVETGSINYINKKILDVLNLETESFDSKFRFFVLNKSLLSPIKFKNKSDYVEPTNNPDYKDLKLKWDIARQGLVQFYDTYHTNIKSNILIYKHPFAGRFTFPQMCGFFDAHLKHHLKQIRRIEGDANFPKK